MPQTFSISAASAYTSKDVESTYPSIAINDRSQIIEVHSQPNSDQNLHYMLGKIDGPTYSFTTDPVSFGKGLFPSVSIKTDDSNNFIIVVFTDTSLNLKHMCGEINFVTKTITWYSTTPTILQDSADKPAIKAYKASVAVNPANAIVVVYQDEDEGVRYKTGILNQSGKTITWNNSKHLSSGIDPKISLNEGISLVEVHQSPRFNSLYYNLGTISNTTGEVTFLKTNEQYQGLTLNARANNPAIAINRHGMVIEVHSPAIGYDLYSIQGQIINSTINLEEPRRYLNSDVHDGDLTGKEPAVAITNDGLIIAVYQSNSNRLYCSVSRIGDKSAWMKDYQSKTLSQLCIPGSHDAAMFMARNCTLFGTQGNTETQLLDIGDQLEAGIRYFDIRPVFKNVTTIYSGHYGDFAVVDIEGCDGESIDDILKDVNAFITRPGNGTEVVILKFSHFLDRVNETFFLPKYNNPVETLTAAQKQPLINKLIKLITEKISSVNLYIHTGTDRITNKTLSAITGSTVTDSTVTGGNGKVIILFDINELKDVMLNNNNDSGNVTYINTYTDLFDANSTETQPTADWVTYDKYSDTDQLSVLTSKTDTKGQLYRLNQSTNHRGDLFLLSWTLTLQGLQNVNSFAHTIVELAQKANGVLAENIRQSVKDNLIASTTFPNILYVDLADRFVTDVCIYLNEQNITTQTAAKTSRMEPAEAV